MEALAQQAGESAAGTAALAQAADGTELKLVLVIVGALIAGTVSVIIAAAGWLHGQGEKVSTLLERVDSLEESSKAHGNDITTLKIDQKVTEGRLEMWWRIVETRAPAESGDRHR